MLIEVVPCWKCRSIEEKVLNNCIYFPTQLSFCQKKVQLGLYLTNVKYMVRLNQNLIEMKALKLIYVLVPWTFTSGLVCLLRLETTWEVFPFILTGSLLMDAMQHNLLKQEWVTYWTIGTSAVACMVCVYFYFSEGRSTIEFRYFYFCMAIEFILSLASIALLRRDVYLGK